MTVVPTASSETNLSAPPVANVSGDPNTTIPVANVTASTLSGTTNDGMQGLPVPRRNGPGTKAMAFCAWPEEDWTEMDSTLAVQQVKIKISVIQRTLCLNIQLNISLPWYRKSMSKNLHFI